MGMYDYINGEQVKCFYRPIYSEKDGIWYSGGHMTGYVTGEVLPTKTLYYKYPSNFLIFDEMLFEHSAMIHIVKDSKVFKTVLLDEFDENYFGSIHNVYNYYGIELNLKNKKDMRDYIEARNKYIEETNLVRGKADKLLNEFLSYHTMDRKLKLMIKTNKLNTIFKYLSLFNKDDKNFNFKFKEILLRYDILLDNIDDLTDEHKSLLIKDENFINDFSKLLIEESAIKAKILDDEHKKEKERIRGKYHDIINKFNDRWYIQDEYKLEKTFGEYLTVIAELYQIKDFENVASFNNAERYNQCKKDFIDFISKNDGIKDKYIKWVDFNEDDKKEIEDILNSYVYN